MGIYENIAQTIGNTPIVKARRLSGKLGLKAELLLKLEFFNPNGSVKDRIGLSMIEDAEKKGIIKKDSVIIEPTSGNTGIALASVAASRGYKLILTMPETMSMERRSLLKALGAEIHLTDGSGGMKGAIDKAEELHKSYPGSVITGQFVNPANPEAHRKGTAPEILKDTDGKLDAFVSGIGTGGTITGTGEVLKKEIPGIKIIAVEPEESAVLSGKEKGPHGIQGIGAGFVPEILNTDIFDEVIAVTTEVSKEYAREAAKYEGILCGISSGAAIAAAAKIACREEFSGKRILAILPDTGERYLSSGLYN